MKGEFEIECDTSSVSSCGEMTGEIAQERLQTILKKAEGKPSSGTHVGHVILARGRELNLVEPAEDALSVVAWLGDAVLMDFLLTQIPDKVNAADQSGYTPLMRAAEEGYGDIIRLLLKAEAELETADADGQRALMKAAAKGQLEAVTLLLDAGATLDGTDDNDANALMLAAANGQNDVVNALLKYGEQSNAGTQKLDAALIGAASSGHAETLELLLKAGADVNGKDQAGWTALMAAACHGDDETMQVLLDAQASLDARDMLGRTALMMAAHYGMVSSVKALLEAGAQPLLVAKGGQTARDMAEKQQHHEVCDLLNEAEENSRQQAENQRLMAAILAPQGQDDGGNALGRAALMRAPEHADYDTLSDLLADNIDAEALDIQEGMEFGEDVDDTDTDGLTDLMTAAQNGWYDRAMALLEAQANVNLTDIHGMSALMYAVKNGYCDLVQLLIDHDANLEFREYHEGYTALMIAVATGNRQIVQELLEAGADAAQRDAFDQTVLMIAAANDYDDIVTLLVGRVSVNAKDYQGYTALMMAAEKNYVEVMEALLQSPSLRVDDADSHKKTALMKAARRNHVEAVRRLLDCGANMGCRDANGHTALEMARNDRCEGVVRLLEDVLEVRRRNRW